MVCIALRRQQTLRCVVYPSSFPWESVQLPLSPQLVEVILEPTNSLHHKCHFIKVRGEEALLFFSLDFQQDFQKERKCDGTGPATEDC